MPPSTVSLPKLLIILVQFDELANTLLPSIIIVSIINTFRPCAGFVFSKGTYGQDNCIYVKQNSGVTATNFNVYYDQCGTKPDLQGKFYENTIVIQYGSDIIEAYDEAKRLRCEWFEAYEKPATFRPAIPVADLDVVEMNFQGDVSRPEYRLFVIFSSPFYSLFY